MIMCCSVFRCPWSYVRAKTGLSIWAVGPVPRGTNQWGGHHRTQALHNLTTIFIEPRGTTLSLYGPGSGHWAGWFWGRFPFCPQVSKRCNPHRLSDDLFLDRLYVTSGRSICVQFNVIKLASGSNSRNKNTSAGNTINITITISIGSKPQRSCLVHSL